MITIDLRISTARCLECIGLLIIFLWLIVHPVLAGAFLRVGNGETYTSIQAAIDAASPGDSIVVKDIAEPYGGFRVTTPDLCIRVDGDPVIDVPEFESEKLPYRSTGYSEKDRQHDKSEHTPPDNNQPEKTIQKTLPKKGPHAIAETNTKISDGITGDFSNLPSRFDTIFCVTLPGESR